MVVSTATFFGALEDVANENERVATATKTMRINIFDFIGLIFSLLIIFFDLLLRI
jgi:hypothetical protein